MKKLLTSILSIIIVIGLLAKLSGYSIWLVKTDINNRDLDEVKKLISEKSSVKPLFITNETKLKQDLRLNDDMISEIIFSLEKTKNQELYDYSEIPETVGHIFDIIVALDFLIETGG